MSQLTDDAAAAMPGLSELEQQWRRELPGLLAADENTLLVSLGRELPPLKTEPLGALPRPDLVAQRAREWISSNQKDLCAAMRKSRALCGFMTNRASYDKVTVTVVVAGAIVAYMAHVVIPVPLTVAVILSRLGLEKICGDDWPKTAP